ncbi:hypothetical protein F5Y04DRAFT_286904, partial [Hypomontagnella monticulosa]
LSCRFDKNFKRISQRQIARDIANGVHIVRSPANGAEDAVLADNHTTPITPRTYTESAFLISRDIESSSFQLGGFSMISGIVSELFQHFEHYYFAHTPFLQPVASLDRLASESPFLFWTIILITCQHHEKHNELYNELPLAHRELLQPLSTRAVRNIQEVHALFLLCLWSLPSRLPLLDPTWTYASIAMDTCMRMNFHNPLPQDHIARGWASWLDSENVTVQDQHLTWLSCFGITTQAAVYQGISPPLSSSQQLRYVKNAVKQLGTSLSPENQANVAIYEIICNYSTSLEAIEDSTSNSHIIQTFDNSLDIIEQAYAAHWTPELDIQLQYAKVNLYAMAVLGSSQTDMRIDIPGLINKQALLVRGLGSASRVIYQTEALTLLPVQNAISNTGKLTFYPRQYITNSFFAAIYLFRMLVDCRPLSQAQVTLALSSIAQARNVFILMPHHRTAAMGADFLGRILDKAQATDASSGALSLPQLLITNRLGASLMYDIIFRLSHFARRDPSHGMGIQNQGGAADNSQAQESLTSDAIARLLDIQEVSPDMSLIQQHSGESFWASWDASFFGEMEIGLSEQASLLP